MPNAISYIIKKAAAHHGKPLFQSKQAFVYTMI